MEKQMQNASKLLHLEPTLSNPQKNEKGLHMREKGAPAMEAIST